MSERYTRLYTLNENIYADGAPIIISAGALLKDTVTENVIAQLKLRNFSKKKVKAVKVEITPYDTADKPLGAPIQYQYLDLEAGHNSEFGSKNPIKLPDNTTRGFDVRVISVVFDDNSEWIADNSIVWTPIKYDKVLLETALGNPDLADEYRIKYGNECNYEPKQLRDLWVCSCGQINHKSTNICDNCKIALASMLALDKEALNTSCEARLAEEKKAAEEAAIEAEKNRRKNKIIALITIPFVLILLFFIIWAATETDRVLAKSNELYMNNELTAAIDVLNDYNKPQETAEMANVIYSEMRSNIQNAIHSKYYSKALAYIKEYDNYIDTNILLESLHHACPHEFNVLEDISATCTEDGVKKQQCSVCEYTDVDIRYALGHENKTTVTKEATCSEEGIKTTTCSICNESTTESIEKLPHNVKSEITRKATCAEKGEKTLTCKICGNMEKEELPTVAHSSKDKITKAATCIETGLKQSICSVCDKVEKEVSIPKTDHTYSYVVTKVPTCVENGSQQAVCIVCEAKGDIQTIGATGHSYTTSVTKAADCTNAGAEKHVCNTCGHTYSSDISALGHSWQDATCTAPKKCTRCGTTTGNALGHNWQSSFEHVGKFHGYLIKCALCEIRIEDVITVTSNAPITLTAFDSATANINITGITYVIVDYFDELRINIIYNGYMSGNFDELVLSSTPMRVKVFDKNGNELENSYSRTSEDVVFSEVTGEFNSMTSYVTFTITNDIDSFNFEEMKSFRVEFGQH